MAKKGKATPPLPLGARAATFKPGFNPGSQAHETWKWEFYIRPDTDEANEKVAAVLARYSDDVRKYERCMALPGYDEKQFVYAVKKQMMDNVDKNAAIRGLYKAFVRYKEEGKIYRHRTPEQLEAAKNRRAKKLMGRSERKGARTS